MAFLGRERGVDGAWRSYLHSHMAAVLPGRPRPGIGTALKLHQRAWALANDLDEIRWTFDPLVRRNAHLNVVRLGVDVAAYLPDFYGEMDDEVNAGDRSDRMIAAWRLTTPRAVAASVEGGGATLPVPALRAEGAPKASTCATVARSPTRPTRRARSWSASPPTSPRCARSTPSWRWPGGWPRARCWPRRSTAGRPLLGMTDDGQYAFGRQP